MADGKIVVKAEVDAKNAQKELDSLTKKIDKMEADLNKSTSEQSGIKAQLDAAKESARQTEAAIKSLKDEASRIKDVTSGNVSVSPDEYIAAYSRQAEVAAQLKEQETTLRQQDKVVESLDGKYARITDKVNEQTAALDAAKTRAGELTEKITSAHGATERMALASEKVSKSMDTFGKRVSGLFKRILVFSLISKALQSLRTWLEKTIMQNEEARAAVARLKAALLTLAQPILNVVVPAFTSLVNVLAKIVSSIAEFVSILFGTSFASSKEAAKGLNEEQKALDGVGSAAKSAEKSLAGFDEINKLTASNASGGGGGASSGIAADFDSLSSALPKWLANLAKALHDFAGDVAIKIKKLKFSWDSGDILKDKDAWIVVLSAILGAIIGTSFGGLSGGVIGLLLGLAIGITTATWTDELENPERAKSLAMIALSALIGASLGKLFGGFSGGVIGLLLGAAIGLIAVEFTEGKFDKWTASDTFNTVMSGILGAATGAAFGGFKGAVLGLLLGVTLSVLSVAFEDELKNAGLSKEGFYQLMDLLLGTIIGVKIFHGISGGVFGLLMGVTITLARIAFDEDVSESSRYAAEAGLRVLLTTLIFALVGAALGGFSPVAAIVGGVIGFGLGVLIQLVKVSFDDSVSEAARNKAAGILKTCMYGLIGAIVGLGLGGNPLTGIIGGIVGIGLGLAIHWTDITYDELPKRSGFGGGRIPAYSASSGISPYLAPVMPPVSAAQLPRLASGAVIPPNSEFLAVLGDQKSGTNIETPLATMVQAFKQAMAETGGMGGRNITVVMQVDKREFARAVYTANNDETQRVGVRLAGVRT